MVFCMLGQFGIVCIYIISSDALKRAGRNSAFFSHVLKSSEK